MREYRSLERAKEEVIRAAKRWQGNHFEFKNYERLMRAVERLRNLEAQYKRKTTKRGGEK